MAAKNLWAKVEKQIASGTFPPVFVSADGRLALDGHGATLPKKIADLYPAEIKAAAEAKAAEHKAAEAAKFAADKAAHDERLAARKAVMDKYLRVRSWRLRGFYVDEQSTARYTLEEINGWLGWDAYNLRHNSPSVILVCERPADDGGEFCVDVSGQFANPCNDRVKTPSFDTLCIRLRDYVAERRANMAKNN